jgi:hypothetical protein
MKRTKDPFSVEGAPHGFLLSDLGERVEFVCRFLGEVR